MPTKEMAWPRQPTDRQWLQPEGDDPRTLYQMLMVSQERFGDEPCFGFIPAPGMPRVHLTYNEFGDLNQTHTGPVNISSNISQNDLSALYQPMTSGVNFEKTSQ